MKKIAVIALQHSEHPNLYLHGRRKDNSTWCMPAGHFETGEHPTNAAIRELEEETGLKVYPIFERKKDYATDHGPIQVYLFKARYDGLPVTNKNDPDREFVEFKFLDPNRDDIHWHVPKERNILLDLSKSGLEAIKKIMRTP
jgi:8-oxo-(d)GTP phosphatase